jgi:hypothetical protein
MLKKVMISQVDTNEEVAKELNKVIDNVNLIETKVCQLASENESFATSLAELKPKEAPKKNPKKKTKKKKGDVLMKTLVLLAVLAAVLFSSLCFGAEQWPITYENVSNPQSLYLLLRNRFANLDSDWLILDPTTTAPTAVEGKIYYDDSTNKIQLYNGTSWVALDTAGGVSLDSAYDFGGAGLGRSISATDGAVAITNTEADATSVLTVTHSGAADGDGITVTVSGSSQDAIEIENTASGYDIEGTGALWYAEKTGAVFVTGLTVNTSDLTFQENGEIIKNDTDNEVEFVGSEDFSIGLGSGSGDQIDFTSDSSAVTIDFTTFDTLKGMTTITGDAAAFTLSITADAAGEDLTIQQAGAVNASIVIDSDGTPTDAINVDSDGGIDVDAADDIAITLTSGTAGEDITITQSGANDSSIIVTADGTGSDAIKLETTNSAGDIWLDSGDDMVVDVVGLLDIDITGAAGEDFSVDVTSGSVILSSGEDVTDAINIDATAGGIDIDAVGEAGQDIVITNTGGSLALSASEDATDAINIDATAGGIDIDATGEAGQDIVITNTGGSISLVSTESAVDSIVLQSTLGGIDILCDASTNEDIDISNTGGAVNIVSSEASDLAIYLHGTSTTSQIAILTADTTTDAIEIDSAGGLEIDTADDITMKLTSSTDAEDFTIQVDGDDDCSIIIDSDGTGADAVKIYASNAAGGIDVDAGTYGINLKATGGDIKLENTTAKDIILDATAGRVLITGTESAADAIILTADGANGEIALSALAGGVDIDAVGGVIALDTSGSGKDITLDATEGAVHIDGGETGAVAVVIDASHSGGGIDMDFGSGGFSLVGASGDMALTVAGDASDVITLTNTNGTGASAIGLVASAGGITAKVVDGKDLVLGNTALDAYFKVAANSSAASEIVSVVNTAGTANGAVVITSSVGGIDMNAKEMFTVDVAAGTAGSADITLTNSVGTDEAAIAIQASAGGVDIDAYTGKNVAINGGQVLIEAEDDAASAIQLKTDTGTSETIVLTNTQGQGTGALTLTATAGGIDINAKEMLTLDVAGGTAGSADIIITNTPGTDDAAIAIDAVAGGIDIEAAASIVLTSEEAQVDAIQIQASNAAGGIDIDAKNDINILLTASAADEDILIATGGDQDSHITITADGSSANAFTVLADAGGIDIDAATDTIHIQNAADGNDDDFTIALTGNHDSSIILQSAGNGTDALSLSTVTNAGDIKISSNDALDIDVTGAMTLDIAGDASTIQMDCDSSGDDLTIDVDGDEDSHLILSSDGTSVDSIYLHQQTATGGGIKIHADDSTNASAIHLVADAGGINVDVAGGKILDIDAGTIQIDSATAGAGAIALTANQGSTDTITITNSQGTANGAITLTATAGGVDINGGAGNDITIDTSKSVWIQTTEAATQQVRIDAQGTGSGNTIELETTNGAIQILADGSTYGDVIIDAEDDVQITVGGHFRIVDNDLMAFGTDDDVTLNYDEDGDDNLQIVGPVDFETTYIEFRSNPVCMKNDGTAVGGATGETDIMCVDGYTFEYFILGAGQAIKIPTMTDDGLNVRLDESDDEGVEMGEGITSRCKSAFTTNTDAFYIKVKFKIETVANLDICAVGFRLKEAYNADMYAYDTYTGLNVNNGTINEIEELNGANAAEVDTGETWADGATHTLETRIAADGVVTWFLDGTAITNQGTTCVFTWSDNDTVIPFFHILGDANAGCEVELISWECGIQ